MCLLAWWTPKPQCASCCSALALQIVRRLENEFVILAAYGSYSNAGVSLLIGHSLNADVNLVLADEGAASWLWPMLPLKVSSDRSEYCCRERVSFYQWLPPFLDNPKQLVLMGDWNVILDPKVDRVGKGAIESGRWERSQIDIKACYDLGDRFRLYDPGREMWTWLDSLPSDRARSFLDRVLEELTLILLRIPHFSM